MLSDWPNTDYRLLDLTNSIETNTTFFPPTPTHSLFFPWDYTASQYHNHTTFIKSISRPHIFPLVYRNAGVARSAVFSVENNATWAWLSSGRNSTLVIQIMVYVGCISVCISILMVVLWRTLSMYLYQTIVKWKQNKSPVKRRDKYHRDDMDMERKPDLNLTFVDYYFTPSQKK